MARVLKRGWAVAVVLAGATVLAACSSSTAKQPAQQTNAPEQKTQAPAATPAAAALYIRADTVIGSKGMSDADKAARSCTAVSHIKPGESLGFRVKVFDGATGKDLEAGAIQKLMGGAKVETVDTALASMTIKLGDGQTFDGKFGTHGGTPPQDAFWSYWWVVPDNYPTGILPYTITVKAKDGRTATFVSDAFNIKSSWLTVVPK